MSIQMDEYLPDECLQKLAADEYPQNFQDTLGVIIGFVMRQHDALHIEPPTQVWERIVGQVDPPDSQAA